jgi:uncharacterized protein YndB with AHSA1/START domain
MEEIPMSNEHDVTVTRTIHAGPARVWEVLTGADNVELWMMGAKVDSTWQPGASITWSGEYDGKSFTDTGEVVEAEPGRRLVHTHTSGGQEHQLRWKLDDAEGSTKLTLVQSGASSAEEADQFKQSWGAMLDKLREVAESGSGG